MTLAKPQTSQRRHRRQKARRRRRKSARIPQSPEAIVDSFRPQHLVLAQRQIVTEGGPTNVIVDETESPLGWLARRRGRDGRVLIESHQLEAGERLRADFTRAHLMPRTTSDWSNPLASVRHGGPRGRADEFTETMIAARQRVHHAMEAVGPEFAGLLIDVCCFLKGLEQIEQERAWPARSGKVVLQLALDRLARHYGYTARARGPTRGRVRIWLADEAAFGGQNA